ncbi:MAG: HEAT repeat domain-containing protein [Desulfuromonadales bacterium]|nr:HEAT repeat domain-containing protein [Desulfuromonadales bacterium]
METALKALAKLLVSIKFYPAGHPALKTVTVDAQAGFLPLLQTEESVSVVVRRTGFFYEDESIGGANPMLQKLAASLFARRVQRLTILKDLSCRDLWETAKVLLLDADIIQKNGGLQTLLQQALVTTIWTNAVDMNSIFELKNQIEEEKSTFHGTAELDDDEFLAALGTTAATENSDSSLPPAPEVVAAPEGELPFEELLKAVEMVSDDQEFITLLQRLVPVVHANLTEKSAHLVLQTLSFLTNCNQSSYLGEEKRRAARQTMTQLSSPALLNFYIDLLCARRRFEDHRVAWDHISRALGDPLAKLLLTRLAAEEEPATRKVFTETLISQGDVALAAIIATLKDDRWQVLRNAAQLLGEIRAAAAIEPLRALLRHRELGVRREALRALTRIGGSSVINIIAKILQGKDIELRRQAMLCLGAIKNPATIPLLVQFLQIRDWQFQHLEAKVDALKALGEIGSTEVLPLLKKIVNHRPLFYRSRNDTLRAAALLAMGEIGGQQALEFLEAMEDDSSPVVEKAIVHALKQAQKGLPND